MKNVNINEYVGSVVYTAKNSRGRVIRYYDIDYKYIKKYVLGRSGGLLVATNTRYKSPYWTIYKIKNEDLKKSALLRALLFGRDNSLGIICITETNCNALHYLFDSYAIGEYHISTFDNCINKGIGFESFVCNEFSAKKTSEKMDKIHKVDIILDNGFYQCKASLLTASSRYKGSITNW